MNLFRVTSIYPAVHKSTIDKHESFFASVEIFQSRIPLLVSHRNSSQFPIFTALIICSWFILGRKNTKFSAVFKCKFDWLCLLSTVRVHSITTWTKFWPPLPLEWTIVDILHDIYPLSLDQTWTFYWPPPILFLST